MNKFLCSSSKYSIWRTCSSSSCTGLAGVCWLATRFCCTALIAISAVGMNWPASMITYRLTWLGCVTNTTLLTWPIICVRWLTLFCWCWAAWAARKISLLRRHGSLRIKMAVWSHLTTDKEWAKKKKARECTTDSFFLLKCLMIDYLRNNLTNLLSVIFRIFLKFNFKNK